MQAKTSERSFKKLAVPANIVLWGTATLLAVVFLWALFHYHHYRMAPSFLKLVLFGLTPATSLIVILFVFTAKPLLKMKVASSVIVLVMGLYLAEAMLAVVEFQRAPRHSNKRTKLEEVLALRKRGVDAYPSIHPREFLERQSDGYRCKLSIDGQPFLPLGGISNATTVTCNEGGEYLTYVSDEHGMHNPQGLWARENLEIVAIGDSFTQGWCVMSDENYVSLIREEYPATLNLGMAGNGPLIMLASLLEFVPDYKPRHVLWFHCEVNDIYELSEEKTCPLLMRYLEEDYSQGLRRNQALVDFEAKAMIEARIQDRLNNAKDQSNSEDRMSFIKLLRTRKRMGLTYDYVPFGGDYEFFRRVLEKAKSTVESWGGTLHIVYLPWSHRYSQMIWTSRDAEPRKEVLRIADELELPVIDVHLRFEEHPQPLSLFVGHYTAEGNQIVADAVLSSLRK